MIRNVFMQTGLERSFQDQSAIIQASAGKVCLRFTNITINDLFCPYADWSGTELSGAVCHQSGLSCKSLPAIYKHNDQ
jgi:hypothetical protein